ncbi:hypothetical protein [Mucilaginibacter ginsenosidivorans]|uniref:TonB-dependent receptor plug domain-containing protein n=1 Tax=Mucilaginibacter ginsenosidivorans TaxID=398053 RepID=A0A5B8V1A3_9SPHI|nr:hypothetical protein [Mucilaginibacter ginsenosidivorans]QEC64968.1 hypothetical protein FRZ54_21145 [Mucilaginibacter ginsenosidivorans]
MKYTAFKALLIIAAVTLCFPRSVNGQNLDQVDLRVRNSLENHYKRYPQEKLFVHSDACVYASGQTIWYKAYAMAYGKPSALSSVAYVLLADSAGNMLVKNKLPIKNGRAFGNIDIPDSLRSGWYQLIGFTAWTMNFGEEGAFHQKIYIQNLSEKDISLHVSATGNYHIVFYPEGGDPVEGSLCNFAFKATDANGRPVNVTGDVLNDEKKAIGTITTLHDGMGAFEIEGRAGHQNIALVIFPDGSVQTVTLPDFKKQGLVLKVNPLLPGNLEVRITCGANKAGYQNVVLAAFQDNGTFNTYPLHLSEGVNLVNIKKNDFSTGILRLTLFSEQGIPEAERITFINNNDQLKLSLKADSLSLGPRTKSGFTLKSLSANGKNVSGNFSVSVVDSDAINEDEAADNIASYFLMSSELQGKVYHPAYYFKNNSDTLQRQLDLVMLTNGWRHFRWDKDTTILKNPVEKSQFIAGRIMGYNEQLNRKNPLRVKLMVQNQDSTKYFAYVEPDSAGRFIIRDYDRAGRASILMQTVNKKDRSGKFKVSLYSTYADSLQVACYSPLDSITDYTRPVTQLFMAKSQRERQQKLVLEGRLLKTVNIRERKLTPIDELIKDHVKRLETNNAESFDLISYPMPTIDILDYLNGRVPGLRITKDPKNGIIFTYHGQNVLIHSGDVQPVFYIDEAPVGLDDALEVPMQEIALIRFVPPPVWFAPLNGGAIGAILIYTKNSNDDRLAIPGYKRFDSYIFNGYTITREFAVPDYSKPQTKTTTDNRTTLYWNHDLNTRRGEAKFSFYNSDNTKHFRIIIQGMDAEGRIGYLEQVY